MNAIILAAGTGSRLVNLTRDLPKALVRVHKRHLIDYTLRFVEKLGIDTISVVGGFYFEKLKQYLEQYSKKIQIFENPEFLKGSVLSLLPALSSQEESFLLLNVDHIYPHKLGRSIRARRSELSEITALVDFDRPLREDDMKVALASDKKILKISKNLHAFDAGYIGMTYVPRDKLGRYKEAAHKIAQENHDAVVEDILQLLVENSEAPAIFNVSGIRWLEVDNQWDLNNAERILSWVDNYLD